MATVAHAQYTVTMPVFQADILSALSKTLNWVITPIKKEKSPYDQKFVKKIKSQEGKKGVKIEIADLWK